MSGEVTPDILADTAPGAEAGERQATILCPRPGAVARTADERVLLSLLAMPLPPLRQSVERRLARRLLELEAASGGWSVDIGLWGETLFLTDARRVIERALGRLSLSYPCRLLARRPPRYAPALLWRRADHEQLRVTDPS